VDVQAGDAFDDNIHDDLPQGSECAVWPLAEGLD